MLLSGGGGSKVYPSVQQGGFPMFKKLLITGAFLALPAAAIAADLPVKATAYAPARPACAQFGGWYAGGHVGYGTYDHTWSDRDAWTSELSDDLQRSNVKLDKSGFRRCSGWVQLADQLHGVRRTSRLFVGEYQGFLVGHRQ